MNKYHNFRYNSSLIKESKIYNSPQIYNLYMYKYTKFNLNPIIKKCLKFATIYGLIIGSGLIYVGYQLYKTVKIK